MSSTYDGYKEGKHINQHVPLLFVLQNHLITLIIGIPLYHLLISQPRIPPLDLLLVLHLLIPFNNLVYA